jgi:hypothetical protein
VQLRPHDDKGVDLGQARLEVAHVLRVVRALGLEDANLGAQFLQLGVVCSRADTER